MVQQLNSGPSFGGNLGSALGTMAANYQGNIAQQNKRAQDVSSLQKAIADAGGRDADPHKIGLSIMQSNASPEAKKLSLDYLENQSKIQATQKAASETALQKAQQGKFEDERTKTQLTKYFGPGFADLYIQSSEGGRTKLLEAGIDAKQRGLDINEVLAPLAQQIKQEDAISQPKELTEEVQVPIKPKIDFDKGLTPKEKIKRQNDRYSKNLPIFQESAQKVQSLEFEKDALNKLEELESTGKLPERLGRLNVNPKTGELLIPALASPEAQEFQKTINNFTTQAKDSYGSRVTNFDLQQFMKRLPTLANTKEGRELIMNQMRLINDLNLLRENSVKKVIDEYGGVRNIDYDQAQQVAEKTIAKEKQLLRDQFKSSNKKSDQSYNKEVEKLRGNVPEGHVMVEFEDSIGYIPKSKLSSALKKGYKKI